MEATQGEEAKMRSSVLILEIDYWQQLLWKSTISKLACAEEKFRADISREKGHNTEHLYSQFTTIRQIIRHLNETDIAECDSRVTLEKAEHREFASILLYAETETSKVWTLQQTSSQFRQYMNEEAYHRSIISSSEANEFTELNRQLLTATTIAQIVASILVTEFRRRSLTESDESDAFEQVIYSYSQYLNFLRRCKVLDEQITEFVSQEPFVRESIAWSENSERHMLAARVSNIAEQAWNELKSNGVQRIVAAEVVARKLILNDESICYCQYIAKLHITLLNSLERQEAMSRPLLSESEEYSRADLLLVGIQMIEELHLRSAIAIYIGSENDTRCDVISTEASQFERLKEMNQSVLSNYHYALRIEKERKSLTELHESDRLCILSSEQLTRAGLHDQMQGEAVLIRFSSDINRVLEIEKKLRTSISAQMCVEFLAIETLSTEVRQANVTKWRELGMIEREEGNGRQVIESTGHDHIEARWKAFNNDLNEINVQSLFNQLEGKEADERGITARHWVISWGTLHHQLENEIKSIQWQVEYRTRLQHEESEYRLHIVQQERNAFTRQWEVFSIALERISKRIQVSEAEQGQRTEIANHEYSVYSQLHIEFRRTAKNLALMEVLYQQLLKQEATSRQTVETIEDSDRARLSASKTQFFRSYALLLQKTRQDLSVVQFNETLARTRHESEEVGGRSDLRRQEIEGREIAIRLNKARLAAEERHRQLIQSQNALRLAEPSLGRQHRIKKAMGSSLSGEPTGGPPIPIVGFHSYEFTSLEASPYGSLYQSSHSRKLLKRDQKDIDDEFVVTSYDKQGSNSPSVSIPSPSVTPSRYRSLNNFSSINRTNSTSEATSSYFRIPSPRGQPTGQIVGPSTNLGPIRPEERLSYCYEYILDVEHKERTLVELEEKTAMNVFLSKKTTLRNTSSIFQPKFNLNQSDSQVMYPRLSILGRVQAKQAESPRSGNDSPVSTLSHGARIVEGSRYHLVPTTAKYRSGGIGSSPPSRSPSYHNFSRSLHPGPAEDLAPNSLNNTMATSDLSAIYVANVSVLDAIPKGTAQTSKAFPGTMPPVFHLRAEEEPWGSQVLETSVLIPTTLGNSNSRPTLSVTPSEPEHPWSFGLKLTEELVEPNGLQRCLRVVKVAHPSDSVVRVGDIITSVDGTSVTSQVSMRRATAESSDGLVKLSIIRVSTDNAETVLVQEFAGSKITLIDCLQLTTRD
eukprot:GILJ01020150.1.p1 GENE.GILJ01020150.1~~GILJ01020150.1.p1  ORF type:complete len:1271 (+),score=102.22 GILJ01020150.1:179-3814(+)